MIPTGWRPPEPSLDLQGRALPGRTIHSAYQLGDAPDRSPRAEGTPFGRFGRFWPGLHLLVGPPGAGATQLAVQAAVESALLGEKTYLGLPDMDRREAALRVAAVLARIPWGQLADGEADAAERWLDRLAGAPLRIAALGAEMDPLSPPVALAVLDPAPGDLARLRRAALEAGTALLVVASAKAEAIPLADRVFALEPGPGPRVKDRPHPTRLVLVKSRRAVPSALDFGFDGASFEPLEPGHPP